MAKLTKYISKKDALIKAQYLCAHQEKCEWDIRKKLYDWKSNPVEHDTIISELIKDKYIDESRYAITFAKEKLRFNKWGKIKIEYALKQKNIPANLINTALNEIDEDNYDLILENELIKKFKTLKDTDEYALKSKLSRFALSKGFENGKVFDIISKILEKNKK